MPININRIQSGGLNPQNIFRGFEDFGREYAGAAGALAARTENSGGTPTRTASVANHMGAYRWSTATSATALSGFMNGADYNFLVNKTYRSFFEASIKLTQLSTAGEEFFFYCGFNDDITRASLDTTTHGFRFAYIRTTSTNWLCQTANGGTVTSTDSGTAVSTNYVRLRAEIVPGGASVLFYIDGTLVATNTTNILDATDAFYIFTGASKQVGTTAVTGDVDYVHWEVGLTR